MTVLASRSIAAAMLAGVMVGLTACHTGPGSPSFPAVCQENLDSGMAIITCQPMDVEITNDEPEVSFAVNATGNHPTFQWYLADPAGNDTPLSGNDREGKRKYVGVDTAKLTIIDPTIADCGFYYCEVDTIDRFGFPVKTQTRRAALGHTVKYPPGNTVERAMTTASGNLFSIVQPLPMPGNSSLGGGCGSGTFCSSVTFRNQNAGFQVSPGKHCFDVALTNAATRTGQAPLNPGTYQIMIVAISGGVPTLQCPTLTSNRWTFVAASGELYLFAAYFTCGQAPKPTPSFPSVALRLNP